MSHYGFEIVQTLIVDIEPDERVKRAMNEINAGTFIYLIIKLLLTSLHLKTLIENQLVFWARIW